MARHDNQGGLALETEHTNSGSPCQVCGRPCGVAFGGVPMHVPCFWATTATTVKELHSLSPAQVGAEQPAQSPPPADTDQRTPSSSALAPATAASSSRQRPKREGEDRFAGPAAVLTADTVYLPGGVTRSWAPQEITHLGDLALLTDSLRLGWGGGEDRLPDVGQIWLTAEALDVLGLPTSVPEDDKPRKKALAKAAEHDLLKRARQAGWEVPRVDVWTKVWHPETFRRGARVVALPWTRVEGVALYEDAPGPSVLADRLHQFAATTGIAYRLTPAATGLDVIDHYRPPRRSESDTMGQGRGRVAVVRGAAELPEFLHDSAQDARIANLEADYSWHRPFESLLAEERDHSYVHGFDRNASYLAPWSNIELGVAGLVHKTGDEAAWDGSEQPGYFLVDEWDWPHWGLPDPGNATHARMAKGRVWVTSHTMKQLSWHEITPTVHESYTWQTSARYLDRAGKALVEGRKTLDPDDPVLTTLKGLYSATVGKLGQREHDPSYHLWRPDWRHHIIAATRTAILHTTMQIANGPHAVLPLMVDRDLIVYASDEPDPTNAWPGDPKKLGGTSPGGWKPAGSAKLGEWGPTWLVQAPKRLRPVDAAQALKAGEIR